MRVCVAHVSQATHPHVCSGMPTAEGDNQKRFMKTRA